MSIKYDFIGINVIWGIEMSNIVYYHLEREMRINLFSAVHSIQEILYGTLWSTLPHHVFFSLRILTYVFPPISSVYVGRTNPAGHSLTLTYPNLKLSIKIHVKKCDVVKSNRSPYCCMTIV